MSCKWHQINDIWVYIQIQNKCDISGWGDELSQIPTTFMTLIFRSRLIWAQPVDSCAVINSHTVAENFVPWNWIVLLCDRRTVFVDACVNTHCRGCDVVLLSPEQDPSVWDPHHHGQTAHWIWGIWGKVWCVSECVCVLFPFTLKLGRPWPLFIIIRVRSHN